MDELLLTVKTSITFQTILNEEIGNGVPLYASGLIICHIALLLVFENGTRLPSMAGQTSESDCKALATTCLVSLLGTITSSVELFALGSQAINFDLLPPYVAYLIYKAAAIVTERLILGRESSEGLGQLRILRRFLAVAGERWLGCGE
jgi:hypothetical protein